VKYKPVFLTKDVFKSRWGDNNLRNNLIARRGVSRLSEKKSNVIH